MVDVRVVVGLRVRVGLVQHELVQLGLLLFGLLLLGFLSDGGVLGVGTGGEELDVAGAGVLLCVERQQGEQGWRGQGSQWRETARFTMESRESTDRTVCRTCCPQSRSCRGFDGGGVCLYWGSVEETDKETETQRAKTDCITQTRLLEKTDCITQTRPLSCFVDPHPTDFRSFRTMSSTTTVFSEKTDCITQTRPLYRTLDHLRIWGWA